MTDLLHQLRSTGAIAPDELDAAMRRQLIYGGSLDTVLLELELLEPAELDAQLSATSGVPSVPVDMLAPRADRPIDAVPRELVDLGWAMPLARKDGRVYVAIHPELPDERLAFLKRSVAAVEPMVTAECCLAKLASEQTGSVIPQRYAILVVRYIQALEAAARGESKDDDSEVNTPEAARPLAAAPWMRTPDPAARPSKSTAEERSRSDTQIGFMAPPTPTAREPERTGPVFAPPPRAWEAAPSTTADPEAPPATPRKPALTPKTLPPTGSVRPLRERIAERRDVLAKADYRDTITDALVAAAMEISPRAALFGIKKEGLRGLPSSGSIEQLADTIVPVSEGLQDVISGRRTCDRVTDIELRAAVRQSGPSPCIFIPVHVGPRPVLMLYVDRDGGPISDEARQIAAELCQLAGTQLEDVLRRMRADSATSEPEPAKPAKPQPTAERPPVRVVPVRPARQPQAPVELTTKVESKPPVREPAAAPVANLPKLVDGPPPQRPNTLLGQHRVLNGRLEPIEAKPAEDEGATLTPTTLIDTVGPAPAVAPSRVATAPPDPDVRGRPSDARTLPGEEPSPVRRDTDQGIGYSATLPGTQPSPLAKPPVRRVEMPPERIVPLSAPAKPATTRARITLDEEDRVPSREPAADSLEAKIDAALDAAKRGVSGVNGLTQFGDAALMRIAAHFPGELDVLRRDLDSLPPLSAHGPLIRVVIQIGAPMASHLIELMEHPNANVRFYAAFAFQELRDDRCLMPMSELAFDSDGDVRAISMRVLETYGRSASFAEAVAHVRRELASPNRTRQLHAARAVGTLRDILAVPKLIELLSSSDRYIQESSLESLCSITGQQLGLKPHRWKSWYSDNGHRHRIEWIIDSLRHKDISVRRWAADELRRITGQSITFPADSDRQTRDQAIAAWLDWWNRVGRDRFMVRH